MPIDERKLAALAKKNAEKVAKEKSKRRHRYDDTLPEQEEEDPDARRLFKEMKKREF